MFIFKKTREIENNYSEIQNKYENLLKNMRENNKLIGFEVIDSLKVENDALLKKIEQYERLNQSNKESDSRY